MKLIHNTTSFWATKYRLVAQKKKKNNQKNFVGMFIVVDVRSYSF